MNYLARSAICLLAGLNMVRCLQAQCECGHSVAQPRTYQPPVMDGFYPNPEVIDVATSGQTRIISIEVDAPAKEDSNFTTTRYVLVSSDEGSTWLKKSETDDIQWRSPASPMVIFKYDPNNQFFRSIDGGKHWEIPSFNLDGKPMDAFIRQHFANSHAELVFHFVSLHPRSALTLYGTFRFNVFSASDPKKFDHAFDLPGVYFSLNGGDDWALFAANLRPDSPLAISDKDSHFMVAFASNGVVKTTDGGANWHTVGQESELLRPAELAGLAEKLEKNKQDPKLPVLPNEAYRELELQVYRIAFQPNSMATIYLITNKGVYRTTDGGDRWCLLNTGNDRLADDRALFFGPGMPDTVYLGTRSKILRSKDGGCTFTTILDSSKLKKALPGIVPK